MKSNSTTTYPKVWFRSLTIRILILALVATMVAACGLGGIKDELKDAKEQAIRVLDDAIRSLNNISADWQVVLQDAIDKLTDEAQSTIRNELSDLLGRGVGAVGVEARCGADFYRNRMRQALNRLKAQLKDQDPPPLDPVICKVVPASVDIELVQLGRLNSVQFYGYDFDLGNTQVFLEDKHGRRVDVSNNLNRPTHYHWTLNLGGAGVPLTTSSHRLALRWAAADQSTIAVLQPTIKPCRILPPRQQTPSPINLMPRHTGEGDREFSGNGPDITVKLTLRNRGSHIDATLYMKARETKKDWTTAEETKTKQIITAPSGTRVHKILGGTASSHSYRDDDHSKDEFRPGGPVDKFVIVGDTRGKDVEEDTQVTAFFTRLNYELIETGNCR